METLRKLWKYVGGGYYRDASIPKGKTAETIHGQDALDEIRRQALEDAAGLVRTRGRRMGVYGAVDPDITAEAILALRLNA